MYVDPLVRRLIAGYLRLTLILLDNSPWTQVVILGFATFSSVGMFSAVNNLGAGYVETG